MFPRAASLPLIMLLPSIFSLSTTTTAAASVSAASALLPSTPTA